MLINLTQILQIAEEKGIALGSFNAPNLESLEAILAAAEEENVPVILQFAQCHEPLIPLEVIGPVMVDMAKKSSVPVCVHLDHGEDLDYLKKALDLGFTGIMFDGSTLPYEENLALTKEAVAMAKKYGAGVEAELGSMGKRELGGGEADDDDTKIYTDPDLAASFIKDSGIDALACSFGTTHGIYRKEPKLDFNVVKNVRAKTDNIPVVMHGGSGVSKEDFHKAVNAGVRKINYFTYMDLAAGKAVSDSIEALKEGEPLYYTKLAVEARAAMKENILEAIRTFEGK